MMLRILNNARALVLAALLLLASIAAPAMASITVTQILVNGGTSVNVQPGDTITVSVTVVLTGGTRWRSTSFITSPTSDLSWCYYSPDIRSNGTYTRTFQVDAPNSQGVFSLNVAGWNAARCYSGASPYKTLTSAINTGPAVSKLNHVRLIHDGSALTCGKETITLKACANATCTSLYTGSVQATLGNVGTWSTNPITFTTGNASLTLANTTAGTVNLSGSVNSPASTTTALQCYKGSTAGDCAMVFSNGACGLDAVEVGKANNTPIFTKRIGGGTLTLDVLAMNSGVINTSATSTVNATLVAASGTGCSTTALSDTVQFTYTGANAGRRSITFTPTAAARDVRVRMTSGSLVQCSSDNFAIRPSTLTLAATGVGADASGTSATASPVLKAGSGTFTLSAGTATGYNGTLYIASDMADSLQGNAGVVAGVGVVDPALPTVANQLTYGEAGYFRLMPYGVYDNGEFASVDANKGPAECFTDSDLGTDVAPSDPNLLDANGKLGCYFGNTAPTTYFGRFVPDHFALSEGSIVHRSAIAACSASTFSYMGEQMRPTFTLTAQNANDETTLNYEGAFARLNLATQLGLGVVNDPPAPAPRTPFPACGATPAHPCHTAGTASGSFVAGEATAVAAPLTLYRPATAAGPYAVLKVGVAPVDPDGVKLGAYDIDTVNVSAGAANHALVDAGIARYGRLYLANAYGSELLRLTLPASAQYWNGTGFVINTLDSCTPMLPGDFTMEGWTGGITGVNMPITRLSSGGVLVAGAGKLQLAKPAPAPTTKGSVLLRSTYPYLPGAGRATFGVYKSGPVIHVRETY
ncbi:MAG TPA: DUF6701 domain-containing protein [Telluria sp.]|jgi:MSHA biogenesis protein MshQ